MIWVLRRLVLAPALVVLTGLLWVSLPLWIIGAAAALAGDPGPAGGRCGCSGWRSST